MCLRLNHIRSLTAILAVLLAGTASAQVNSATLLGTVKDSTGASIPGATVTARNIETGQERIAKTDETLGKARKNLVAMQERVEKTFA